MEPMPSGLTIERKEDVARIIDLLIDDLSLDDLTGPEELTSSLADTINQVRGHLESASPTNLDAQYEVREFEWRIASKINALIDEDIENDTIDDPVLHSIHNLPLSTETIHKFRDEWFDRAIADFKVLNGDGEDVSNHTARQIAEHRSVVAAHFGAGHFSDEEQIQQLRMKVRDARRVEDGVRLAALAEICNVAYDTDINKLDTRIDKAKDRLTKKAHEVLNGKNVVSMAARQVMAATALVGVAVATTAAASPAAAAAVEARIDQDNNQSGVDAIQNNKITIEKKNQQPATTASPQDQESAPLIISDQPSTSVGEKSGANGNNAIAQQEEKPMKASIQPVTSTPQTTAADQQPPLVIVELPHDTPASTPDEKPMQASPHAPSLEITILPPAENTPPAINTAPAPVAPATPEAPSTSPEQPAAANDFIQAARDLAKRTDQTPYRTSWENTSFMMEYLLNHGFEPHQAIGIVANSMWESSGVVFDKPQDDGTGFGAFQYDGDRKKKLFAEAARLGKSAGDRLFQMDFFMQELEQHSYLGLAELKATTNSADATRSFEKTFERAGKPYIDKRLELTELIRTKFNEAFTKIQHAKEAAAPDVRVPAGWPSDPEAARAMFNQCDPRWGNIVSPHGIRTCNIACGPTSVAWVVDALRPEVAITPKETIEFMNKNDLWLTPEGGARDSGGASFDDVKILGENWGLKGEQMKKPDLHNIEAYKEIFKKGGKIIAAGSGPSPFVQAPAAHFVIIRGITDDGKFLINDPYPKPDAPDTNERPWDANQIMNGIFGAVVFTK